MTTITGEGKATPRKRINTDMTTGTATASGMGAKKRAKTIPLISVRAIMTAPLTVTGAGWDRRTATVMDIVTATSAATVRRFIKATAADGGVTAITTATIMCTSGRTGRDGAGVGDAVLHTTMATRTA